MNEQVVLISYGEIALKKGRRHLFEKKLLDNLRKTLKGNGCHQFKTLRGRIKIALTSKANEENVCALASKVFGVVGVHPSIQVDSTWEAITQKITEMIKEHPLLNQKKTFGVQTIRPWKEFSRKSYDVGRDIGALVLELAPNWSVNLSNPDVEVIIEIHKENTYISTRKIKGPGGLPSGSAGKLALLLSGGIDSPVAGYMMQNRGAKLIGLYFHSHPYTSDQALNKVKDLARILGNYQLGMSLYMIHLTQIQETIRDKCDPKYAVILTRRMMMRLSQIYSARRKTKGLVTGESLAQVASQTLENMAVIGNATFLPIYRPLIGFDKIETIKMAKNIGTYDISIRPYEDCCSLFVDPHPITDARLKNVLAEEEKLNVKELIQQAMKLSKRIILEEEWEKTSHTKSPKIIDEE